MERKVKTPVKKEVFEEVKRFAKDRDQLFDKAKGVAGNSMANGWNAARLLKDPKKYLRNRFSVLGMRVAREMTVEARKVGKDHAEKLGQLGDSST